VREVNIFNLIKNSNAEIVVAAAISCVITLIYSSSHKLSSKKFFIISFILGTAGCFLLSLSTNKFSVTAGIIKNSVSGGTLSVTVTAFIKRFAFISSDDVKESLQQLLSSIILSDKLDEVVDEIINNLRSETSEITLSELKSIIKENTSLCDDEKLDEVCRIVMEALEKHEKT